MAHTATTERLQFPGMYAVKITVTWDTSAQGTPAAISHGGPTNSKAIIIENTKTHPSTPLAFTAEAVLDEANGELDVDVVGDGGGSVAGAVSEFVLLFPDYADQDGSSLTSSPNY